MVDLPLEGVIIKPISFALACKFSFISVVLQYVILAVTKSIMKLGEKKLF
jgi:hypothetical protein